MVLWRGFLSLNLVFLCAFSLVLPAKAESTMPMKLPPEAKKLHGHEIESLLGSGATFQFFGAKGLVTGTSAWNLNTHTAYGTFEWEETLKGTWNLNWKVEGDQSCLENAPEHWECEFIYAYEDGFFEVDENGAIHTFSKRMAGEPLAKPLTAERAAKLLPEMMKWAQKLNLEVVSSSRSDGVITVDMREVSGNKVLLQIEAETGLLLSNN